MLVPVTECGTDAPWTVTWFLDIQPKIICDEITQGMLHYSFFKVEMTYFEILDQVIGWFHMQIYS